jgi:hypothetical protein
VRPLRIVLALVAASIGLLLTLPVIIFAIPFALIAGLTKGIARLIEPRFVQWHQLIEFDPSVGWKPKAHLDTHYFAERDDIYHLTTDAEGWPGKTTLADSQLVVFGDSYAFGYGVEPTASFVARASQVRVKAIGAPGYNLVQELLLMRQLSPRLSGKLVVWFVYLGNDLFDNLAPSMRHYRTPFVRETPGVDGEKKWEIVTAHLTPQPWSYSAGRHRRGMHLHTLAALHSPTFLAQRAYAACEFLMQEGAQVCQQAGARLVVLTIPSPLTLNQKGLQQFPHALPVDPQLPDRAIGEACRKLGVRFVAGKDFLTEHHYKTHDDHWNERGHHRVAEELNRLYAEHVSHVQQVLQIQPAPCHTVQEPRSAAENSHLLARASR